MNKQEYVNALRELADFIEGKDLPDTWGPAYSWSGVQDYPTPEMTFQFNKKEEFGDFASKLGTFDKESSDYNVSIVSKLSSGAKVTARIAHEQVCEKVVTGKKTVPFRQAYMVDAVEEHEEDIVEWKCPESFIALKGETNELAQ